MRLNSGALVILGMILFTAVFFGMLVLIALDQRDGEASAVERVEEPNGCEFVPSTEPVLVFERTIARWRTPRTPLPPDSRMRSSG